MAQDIYFDVDGVRVNVRVGALVSCGDLVLLCRVPGEGWWYVPGGRVQAGESSVQALRRELAEELAGDWEIGSARLCTENFFCLWGRRYQELCTYYRVRWLSASDALVGLSHEVFQWVEKGRLEEFVVKPGFIARFLASGDGPLEHVMYRDASWTCGNTRVGVSS